MLTLKRIRYPEDRADYEAAWDWMRKQPELYGEDVGFDDFDDFILPDSLSRIEFALKQDGHLIAFAYFVLRARKVCEFGLVTPLRPRVRSILVLLRRLQRDYFENLGFIALYAQYPDDSKYDRPRRLCRMFGWHERKPNYFEYTILDFLREHGNQEEAHNQSACAV